MKYIILMFLFTSCLSSSKPIHLSRIAIGMEKDQVAKGLYPRRLHPIGAKQYPSSVVEVFQVSRRTRDSWMDNEYYWLYFMNGHLSEWGRPGDWQRQADVIYEVRTIQPFVR